MRPLLTGLACVAMVLASGLAPAQLRTFRAELTPLVVTSPVQAGRPVTLRLKVRLPDQVHVQSNAPRDPNLIPTVLTLEPPAGARVMQVIYPAAVDFVQAQQRQPLAVYGPEFTITVRLALAADVSVGGLAILGRLRYQACDAIACYPPAKADTRWTLSANAEPATP